jgi:hypothetical protein
MNVEFWNSIFQWGSVTLVAITFFVGAGALWTGNAINARQAERLISLETELGKQQVRAANAERQLLEIKERQSDRTLTDEQFLRLSKALSVPRYHPNVQMMFIDQGEPKRFSELLLTVFERAGWKANIVKWNRAGMLAPGVWVESLKGDTASNEAALYLAQQLVNVGTPAMIGQVMDDATFPPNTVLVRVGPRPR